MKSPLARIMRHTTGTRTPMATLAFVDRPSCFDLEPKPEPGLDVLVVGAGPDVAPEPKPGDADADADADASTDDNSLDAAPVAVRSLSRKWISTGQLLMSFGVYDRVS